MKTKKFLMLLAAMLLSSACAFAQNENNNPARGDVNGDGMVDVADIVSVIAIMKKGGGTATLSYFYLGTTEPTAENYKTLSGVVTCFASFDDAIGATASIAAGETLYLLCPVAWWEEKKTPVFEDKDGNAISFLEEKDNLTISDYVIYKTQVWDDVNDVTLIAYEEIGDPDLTGIWSCSIYNNNGENTTNFSLSLTQDGQVTHTCENNSFIRKDEVGIWKITSEGELVITFKWEGGSRLSPLWFDVNFYGSIINPLSIEGWVSHERAGTVNNYSNTYIFRMSRSI